MPTVGILLNVTEDHLDRHGSMENYAAIKERLAAQIEASGTAVIGVDDGYTRAAAGRIAGAGKNVVRVSVAGRLPDGYYAEGSAIMRATGGKTEAVAQLAGIGSLRGVHNAQNAASAVAACIALGLDLPAIQRGLASFPGLAHRMQPIARQGKVLFVNDFEGDQRRFSRQGAGELSRHFLDCRRQAEDRRHREPCRVLPAHRQGLSDRRGGGGFRQHACRQSALRNRRDLDRAVPLAARDAAGSGLKEPVVLLSPACASFDQYPNFEVRGNAFTDLVLALPGIAAINPSS